ncbi:MAG: AMP-binding protein [Deltaproteobacteria bacterium]|nr:AMP-binding protein [Deltaproteobacteria bacterium]
MRIVDAAVRPIRLCACGTAPARRAFLLDVWDDAGHSAFGEAAPLPGYGGGDVHAIATALQRAAAQIGEAGVSLEPCLVAGPAAAWQAPRVDRAALAGCVRQLLGDAPPAARFALEQAIVATLAQRLGVGMATLLGGSDGATLVVHELGGGTSASAHVKFKVQAGGVDTALQAAGAALDAGAEGVLLDANGSLDDAEAALLLDGLAGLARSGRHITVEEPIAQPDPTRLAALHRPGVTIALDEQVRDVDALHRWLAATSVGAVVVKPTCSGLLGALELIDAASAAGLRVHVTSTFEGPIAARGVAAVARCVPQAARGSVGLGAAAVAQVEAESAATPTPRTERVPAPITTLAALGTERPALVLAGETLTVGTLRRRIAVAERAIRVAGMLPGDRLALPCRDDLDAVATLHAAIALGIEVALLPPDAAPAQARRLDAALQADVHADALPCADAIEEAVTPGPAPLVALGRPWVRLTSSGTTGAPHVVALTGRQLVWNALATATRLGLGPADRWLSPLPWHHVGGLAVLLRCALVGAVAERCAPDVAAIEAGARRGATHLSLTPAMLQSWLDHRADIRAAPLPLLRAVLVGGAACPPALVQRALEAGLPLARTYGASEAASGICTTLAGAAWPDGADGSEPLPPLLGVDLQTTADRALRATGPSLPGGRWQSRDAATLEPGGMCALGRLDDVIVSGGAKVDPRAVEALLQADPAVAAALVTGRDDARWGRRPIAALVPAAGRDPRTDGPSLDALRQRVRQALPRYAAPDAVYWVRALPANPGGIGKPSGEALRRLDRLYRAGEQQRSDDALGQRPLAEAGPLDGDVDVHDLGAQHLVLFAEDREAEAQRAGATVGDADLDPQRVAKAHRGAVAGLGVDQRHRPIGAVEDARQRQVAGGEAVLEGLVGEFEGAGEVDDSSRITVLEAHDAVMDESHGGAPWRRAELARQEGR